MLTRWRIQILVVLALVGLGLGWIGFDQHLRDRGEEPSALTTLYHSLALFGFEAGPAEDPIPWTLNVARFLSPLVVLAAAISAFFAVFDRELQRIRARFTLRDHVVVVGLGTRGFELSRNMADQGQDCAIVELTHEHHPNLPNARRAGIPVITTGGENPDLLSEHQIRDALLQARIDRARAVIVSSESMRLNARVAHAVASLQDEDRAGRAVVEITDVFALRALQVQAPGGGEPRIEYYNLAERGGKALLDELDQLLTVRSPDDVDQHLVVVGCTALGRSIAVQAARNWSRDLARLGVGALTGPRPHITLVDPSAAADDTDDEVAVLQSWEPRIGTTVDQRSCSLELLHDRLPFVALADHLRHRSATAVVIAADDERSLLSDGLAIGRALDGVPMWMCTDSTGGLIDLVYRDHAGRVTAPQVFHTHDKVLRHDEILRGVNEDIAIALHLNYRRYRNSTSAGSLAWAELAEPYRDLNRVVVPAWRAVLRSHGWDIAPYRDLGAEARAIEDPLLDELAQAYHSAWLTERQDRTRWPEPRGNEVPWAELSPEDREFNRRQAGDLPQILAAAGLQLQAASGDGG